MEMTILEQGESVTRVALKGRLDMPGVDQVELKFNAVVGPAGKNAIVDFSEVSFLSSMGIRMLLSVARLLSRKNAKLVLLAPQPLVLESIRHASLEQLMPIAADEAAARALFAQ